MPDFSWQQVVILSAVIFGAGLWVQYRFHPLNYLRKRPSLKDFSLREGTPPDALSASAPKSSAVRSLEDQFSQGNLSFNASLELAEVYRRQGDVQAAIDIHQSLYGRPGLSWDSQQRAQLELAKDFYSAGILGRAEDLFRSLIAQHGTYSTEAARLLLKIYQQQKDWEAAVNLFKAHQSLASNGLSLDHVHMLCEQAQYLAGSDTKKALQLVKEAVAIDAVSRRPLISFISLAVQSGADSDLNRYIQRYIDQHSDRMDLLRNVLRSLCLKRPEYVNRITPVLTKNHHNPEVRLIHGDLLCRLERMEEGVALLDSVPVNGVTIAYQLQHLSQRQREPSLERIARTLSPLKDQHWLYRCSHCGYETSAHHWHCPQCDRWETLNLNQGQFANLLI
ncbi:hypothetical protein NFC81_08425 [Salinispirillum sp. LH 10-3-1]|uniref:LapB rubredoxin metal binding domain-containing protein n=1 Tax=Salinispirillum sp. LH 10-3-1 TaxID=2952525 RepID=A0AB38YBT8_9GAMM